MFELLACDRLTSNRPLWVIVFVPMIFGSVASVGACVWSVKHDRSFELELFMAVNALQFVFLPLKLDELVNWSWEIVFVPLWICLCISLVGRYIIGVKIGNNCYFTCYISCSKVIRYVLISYPYNKYTLYIYVPQYHNEFSSKVYCTV